MNAVRLGVKNVRVAWDKLKSPVIFRRNAHFCADGYKTGAPTSVSYSSVIYRDSVQILQAVAALNKLEEMGTDIQNAFLTAPNKEKGWMVTRPEFWIRRGQGVSCREGVVRP